ncbi:MAG: prepilin peptidase [Myxococcales bacterium]|jgi:prepilin peptidase CpaA|nr:prepilin peptidase [Myxococcales bacterium]
MSPQHLNILLYSIVALALIISVVTDFRSRKIKNVVTLPTIVITLALRLIFGGWGQVVQEGFVSGGGFFSGLVGMIVSAVVFWFMRAGMGPGDLKLMAAVGAGVGFPSVIFCFMGTGLVGGIHAIVLLLWKGEFLHTLKNMGKRAVYKMRPSNTMSVGYKSQKIPYGFAIALGSAWGIWWKMMH